MQLPTLYKRTELGKIQVWTMHVEGDKFWSVEGLQDGAMTINKPTVCKGKNIGRANETSPSDQAAKEAQAKWRLKKDKGYSETVAGVDKTAKKFFKPMLAKKYADFKNRIKFPVLCSRKIDGARLIATKDRLITRNGKVYSNCQHISKMLEPLFAAHPRWIIDSEIYSHDAPFERIMHVVRQTKPTQADIEESEKTVKIYVFDGVADDPKEGFKSRFSAIRAEITKLIPDLKYIVFVDNFEAGNHDEIMKFHEQFVSESFEGVMIRIPDAPYENKRSSYLLKYKSFTDAEFVIEDVVEGKGVRAGLAGNLLLKLADGRTFGAGLRGNEAYYRQLLKDKKQVIGRKATIRYQELSSDGIPRFPVCVSVNPFDR